MLICGFLLGNLGEMKNEEIETGRLTVLVLPGRGKFYGQEAY